MKSSKDVYVSLKCLFDPEQSEADISTPPLPFHEERYQYFLNKTHRIGYLEELPSLPTTSSVKRMMKETIELLKK